MAFKRYSPPKPLTPDELAWFEDVIRLQTDSQPVQLELKLDTGTTEFGNGFDDESEEMPMETRVIHEPV
jgi:hypothetical protein